MYDATLKHNLECDVFAMCVSEDALSRTNDLLDHLYSELDINDYLDVLEYALGHTDDTDDIDVDDELAQIAGKLHRVALAKE